MKKQTEDSDYPQPHAPRIAFFDIETSPMTTYVWDRFLDGEVIKVIEDWKIIAFAVKWEGQKKTHTCCLADFPLYKKDPKNDLELVEALWHVFNEADILVAHNGDEFDVKKANARFIQHNLPPPSPYKQIDTKKIAKQKFKFGSNRLCDLADFLGVQAKRSTGGFGLWEGCMRGDKKSWSKMKYYNEGDVITLEQIYLAMRPWAANLQAMTTYGEIQDACPKCCSKNLNKRGWAITGTSKKPRYNCLDCGAWSLGKGVKIKINVT